MLIDACVIFDIWAPIWYLTLLIPSQLAMLSYLFKAVQLILLS